MKGIGEEIAHTVFKRMKQQRNKFKSAHKNSGKNLEARSPSRSPVFGGNKSVNSFDISGDASNFPSSNNFYSSSSGIMLSDRNAKGGISYREETFSYGEEDI